MSHTVSGKITRAPKIQAGTNNNGQYTAFFFEISEFIKGYGDQKDGYTNYSVAFFPKSQGAIDFHMKAIQEGAFVVVSCDKLKIDISNVDYPKLKMDNARLENFFNPNAQATQQAQAPMQMAPQQAPQMAPAYQAQQQAPQAPVQQQQMAPQQQAPQAPVQQQQMAPPQQAPQMAPQQQAESFGAKPQPQPANNSQNFDDDIPF